MWQKSHHYRNVGLANRWLPTSVGLVGVYTIIDHHTTCSYCSYPNTYQHASDAFPVDPHDTEIGSRVVAPAREANREPIERAAIAGREVRFELYGPRPIVDRPVDGRPARIVQRCGVHATSLGPGRVTTCGRQKDDDDRCDGRPPMAPPPWSLWRGPLFHDGHDLFD